MSATAKRVVSKFLLAFLLAVGLCFVASSPALASTDFPDARQQPSALTPQDTSYDVWVGGVEVTSANASDVLGDGGSVKYAPASQTLTLKNAKIKNGRLSGSETPVFEAISFSLSGTFTIKVSGKNTISPPKMTSPPQYAFGIADWSSNQAKLKIKGTGSLTIRAADASYNSQAIAVWKAMVVQGSVKLKCQGGACTNKSTGIDAPGGITVKGSAQVVAIGESGAFTKAPKFSSYKPKVKAGYSSKDIRVNKKKPAKSVYTKYPYVKITKAASPKSKSSSKASSKSSSSSNKKAPAKMKITQLEVLDKQFLVHWDPLTKNCTGYQMEVAESSKFPSDATRKYAVVTDKTYKGAYAWGLDPGTKYYVRVRAYNTVNGKKVWGAYSNVKSAVAVTTTTSFG